MGHYTVKYRDNFVARVEAPSRDTVLGAVLGTFPGGTYPTGGKPLKTCDPQLYDNYVRHSNPNTWDEDFIVVDELRLLDSEIDRQIFGHQVQIDLRGNPTRTTNHTLVPFYSTNEAEAEIAWKQAFSNLCSDQYSIAPELCQKGPKIVINNDNFVIGLYELGAEKAPTKARALCIAALKTVVPDILPFSF